jgi:outer membrane protein TolC
MVHALLNVFAIGFILCTSSIASSALAAVPNPEIQRELKKLLKTPSTTTGPVRLSLKQVTLAAIQNSDSFRATVAQAFAVSSARLKASAITDTTLSLSAQQEWNRNQPNNPFGTVRYDQFSADLALAKRFSTGTSVQLGLTEVQNDSTFGGTFGAFGVRGSSARLQISQSLWRDFLGQSSRMLIQAGELSSKQARLQVEAAIETWFTNLASIYHQAWLNQQRIEALELNLVRRELLAKLFKRRQSLGVSEEADRLQIESALENNRIQKVELDRSLEKTWQLLIVTLKLPDAYRDFKPREIPLEIPKPVKAHSLNCNTVPQESRATRMAELQMQALQMNRDATADSIRPDLSLNLGLVTNANLLNQNDQITRRWADTFLVKNPAWTIGLSLNLPLDASASKADALNLASQAAQLEAQARITQDQLKVDFEAYCTDLKVAESNLSLYTNLEAAQKRRSQLEDTRYRQARSSPFSVLQAGDEWYGSAVAQSQAQVTWWETKFKLDQTEGTLFKMLDEWVQTETGKGLSQTLDQLDRNSL